MKRDDLIYLAGLFDGEGCIHIAKRRKRKDGRRKYSLLITMGMTRNREILDLLKNFFGGSVQKHVIRRSKKLMKVKRWIWYITSIQALEFIRVIIPFLRIKKIEAYKALELQVVGKGKKFSEESLAERRRLYLEMRRLKR